MLLAIFLLLLVLVLDALPSTVSLRTSTREMIGVQLVSDVMF